MLICELYTLYFLTSEAEAVDKDMWTTCNTTTQLSTRWHCGRDL